MNSERWTGIRGREPGRTWLWDAKSAGVIQLKIRGDFGFIHPEIGGTGIQYLCVSKPKDPFFDQFVLHISPIINFIA